MLSHIKSRKTRAGLKGMTVNRTINAAPVVAVEGLTLWLAGEKRLDNVSFQVSAGERVCLLGASGSGKSLTAKALTGTLPAGAIPGGSLRVNGIEVCGKHPNARTPSGRVATVFQDSSTALNPLMKLGKQLRLALPQASENDIAQMLAAVGLDDIAHFSRRYPAELSGGQRQRVCLALAMQSDASVLIADEPTTALDVLSQQQVLQVIRDACTPARRPKALLFITHDIAVAAQLCERALVMENGQLVESASMAQLLSDPQHPYSRRLVHAAKQASLQHNAAPLYEVAV